MLEWPTNTNSQLQTTIGLPLMTSPQKWQLPSRLNSATGMIGFAVGLDKAERIGSAIRCPSRMGVLSGLLFSPLADSIDVFTFVDVT